MRVYDCPIDPSLSLPEASTLLADLKPRQLILPASCVDDKKVRSQASVQCNSIALGVQRGLKEPAGCAVWRFAELDALEVPIERKLERQQFAVLLRSALLCPQRRP